jgi:hypothetical protein
MEVVVVVVDAAGLAIEVVVVVDAAAAITYGVLWSRFSSMRFLLLFVANRMFFS